MSNNPYESTNTEQGPEPRVRIGCLLLSFMAIGLMLLVFLMFFTVKQKAMVKPMPISPAQQLPATP